MKNENLVKETANGMLWSFASRFLQLGIQLILTIILSRLLTPEDFATVGLLNVFTLLCAVIIDSGFGQALIRKENLKEEDSSTVFWINLGLGLFIYLVLYMVSPLISEFYNIEELTKISRIVFGTLVINAACLVPQSLLTRNLNFKPITIASIVSLFVSAVCGIIYAIIYKNVYALVVQMMVYFILNCILINIFNKWHPRFIFSVRAAKEMLPFSLNLLGSGLLVVLFNNLYTLIIGKSFSQKELGYYTQAKKIEEIPSLSITTIIQNVSYSSMAKVQNDTERLKRAYLRILSINLYIVVPLMAFCFVSSTEFIPFVFGSQWLPIVPYFRILCVYGAIFPLMSINVNILKVKGFGKDVLKLEIVRRALMIVFLIATIQSSMELMLSGWVVSMLISILYSFVICGKKIDYSVSDQLKDIVPYFVISIIPAIVAFIVDYMGLALMVSLIIKVLVYAAVFLLMSFILKVPAFIDLVSILKTYINKE